MNFEIFLLIYIPTKIIFCVACELYPFISVFSDSDITDITDVVLWTNELPSYYLEDSEMLTYTDAKLILQKNFEQYASMYDIYFTCFSNNPYMLDIYLQFYAFYKYFSISQHWFFDLQLLIEQQNYFLNGFSSNYTLYKCSISNEPEAFFHHKDIFERQVIKLYEKSFKRFVFYSGQRNSYFMHLSNKVIVNHNFVAAL